MWTVQIILLLFGLILVASAIVGGGLEIKEIRIPKMTLLPRVLAGAVGLACVVMALFNEFARDHSDPPQAAAGNSVAPVVSDPAIVTDRLGNRQSYLRVSIDIDGRRAGEMILTSENPTGRVEIPPTNRIARYLLRGEEVTRSGDAEGVRRQLGGEGTIVLAAGSVFCIRTAPEGREDELSHIGLAPLSAC